MTTENFPSTVTEPVARHAKVRRRTRFPLCCLLAMALLATALNASAQQPDQPDGAINAPWNTLSTAPYLPDSTFHNGLYITDLFDSTPTGHRTGERIVSLLNGDFVVVGLVPAYSGGNKSINLGLVRYNGAGQRVAWTHPGTGNYVIYPNTDDPFDIASVYRVADIKIFADRIFVLVDHGNGNGSGADFETRIVVFGTDGGFRASTPALALGQFVQGGGMVIFGNSIPPVLSVAIVGYTSINLAARPVFVKGTINSDSTVTFDPVTYPNPGNYCPLDPGCILNSITHGKKSGEPNSPIRFYLGGHAKRSDGRSDILIMAVDANGTPDTGFAGTGANEVLFEYGGGNYGAITALSVDSGYGHEDHIHAVSPIVRACKTGTGIIKLTGNGGLDQTFGDLAYPGIPTGKLLIGGSNEPDPALCDHNYRLGIVHADVPSGVAFANGKLAISGEARYGPGVICTAGPCPEDNFDGELTVIDTAHGDIDSFQSYPLTTTVGGPRTRHSYLADVVPGPSGTFIATGAFKYFELEPGFPIDVYGVATIRLRSNDGIFANSFE